MGIEIDTARAPGFERVCIWGAGLIGCSFAAALKAQGLAREVLAVDRDAGHLRRARELGYIDRGVARCDALLAQCELHLIALPVASYGAALTSIAAVAADDALITDAGSTKREVVALARALLNGRHARFVAGHPIAGKETSGPAAADAALFRDKRVILTPEADTDARALRRVAQLWRALGATVATMPAAQHDAVFAAVSHLPHAIAFAYLALLTDDPALQPSLAHAGSGFRDFSRIGAASPEMWRDICLSNRGDLLHLLEAFQCKLRTLGESIARGDGDAVFALFERASARRSAMFQPASEAAHAPPPAPCYVLDAAIEAR